VATGGGGGEWEPNQILLQEPAYVSNSKPQETSMLEDPNGITKPAIEEWDQSNLRLINYAQNSERRLS
jgi:hypothetical protein